MDNFEAEYKKVISTLQDYGWYIAPNMIGADFMRVKKLCNEIELLSKTTIEERKVIYEKINIVLLPIVFHPNFRAFSVSRAINLPHTEKYSHFIEKAIFHYYKNDFFSTVICLIPAIEGILLSYINWKKEDRRPTFPQIIEALNKVKENKNARYQMYMDGLIAFLQKWMFIKTSNADFSLSYLNRHYVLHSLGNEKFYYLSDCNRLISFFDLLLEVIGQEARYYYVFIPDEPAVNQRREYYIKLNSRNISFSKVIDNEESFLKEHKYYTPERESPNYQQMVAEETLSMISYFEEIGGLAQNEKSSFWSWFIKRKKSRG